MFSSVILLMGLVIVYFLILSLIFKKQYNAYSSYSNVITQRFVMHKSDDRRFMESNAMHGVWCLRFLPDLLIILSNLFGIREGFLSVYFCRIYYLKYSIIQNILLFIYSCLKIWTFFNVIKYLTISSIFRNMYNSINIFMTTNLESFFYLSKYFYISLGFAN